jgi:hypothetical protein
MSGIGFAVFRVPSYPAATPHFKNLIYGKNVLKKSKDVPVLIHNGFADLRF